MNEVSREMNCLRDKKEAGLFVPEFPVPETVPGMWEVLLYWSLPPARWQSSFWLMGNVARSWSSSHCLFRRWELRTSSEGQTRSAVVGPCLLVPPPLLSVHAPAAQISLDFSGPVLFLTVQLSPTLTLFLPFLILHGWLLNLFIIMFSSCIGI